MGVIYMFNCVVWISEIIAFLQGKFSMKYAFFLTCLLIHRYMSFSGSLSSLIQVICRHFLEATFLKGKILHPFCLNNG